MAQPILKPQPSARQAPWTSLELVKTAAEFLARKGIEGPRLDAEVLLAHVLCCERITLYTHFDKPLAKEQVDAYREMIRQRSEHTPTKYLTGRCEFASLDFEVNRSVLIPRPETEFVVAAAVEAAQGRPEPVVMDVGTGSGNIAVAVAKAIPAARVLACDLSPEAVATAQGNVARHALDDRVVVTCGDLFEAFPQGLLADVIVSNPPYIATLDMAALQPEIRLHEPAMALNGGEDGLDLYRRIAAGCPSRLKADGALVLEMGQGQRPGIESLLCEGGRLGVVKIVRDYANIERVMVAKCRGVDGGTE